MDLKDEAAGSFLPLFILLPSAQSHSIWKPIPVVEPHRSTAKPGRLWTAFELCFLRFFSTVHIFFLFPFVSVFQTIGGGTSLHHTPSVRARLAVLHSSSSQFLHMYSLALTFASFFRYLSTVRVGESLNTQVGDRAQSKISAIPARLYHRSTLSPARRSSPIVADRVSQLYHYSFFFASFAQSLTPRRPPAAASRLTRKTRAMQQGSNKCLSPAVLVGKCH